MEKIAVVIVDTYANKHMAVVAINMALKLPIINQIYTFSDEPFFEGAVYTEIPKILTNNEYGNVIFNVLPEVVTEDHFLVIQWDGFPLIPSNWKECFLKYDYIGAPILWKVLGGEDWVGNGGFSLRSQKLLKNIKKLNIQIDLLSSQDQPEDQIICQKNRPKLERMGVKFAPLEIATQFSYQAGALNKNILGFHSADNFPIFFPEGELLNYADAMLERMGQPKILLRFLENCLETKKIDLFRSIVKNYESKPNVLKAVNYEKINNPRGGLINLLQNICLI